MEINTRIKDFNMGINLFLIPNSSFIHYVSIIFIIASMSEVQFNRLFLCF